jgi:hypothetical protein
MPKRTTHLGNPGLDHDKALRHLAFHRGAGPGQPVVVIAPPLFQPRLVFPASAVCSVGLSSCATAITPEQDR